MAGVSFRDVKKNFGAVKVIHGVTMDVDDGEFVVIVGPSGCSMVPWCSAAAGWSRGNSTNSFR